METDTARQPVPRQGILIGGIFAGVLLLLCAGYYFFLRGDYVVLAQQLKPADASALVAELDKRHLSYRLRDGGTTVLVPEAEADRTRVAVAGSDISNGGQIGFELFNKSDMGLTDFAQKINYQRALQGELARTIAAMDGVDSARVHLALPERSLFRAERSEPKAAVSVAMKLGQTADPARVVGIQRLVAAAVPDLPEAKVVVLDAAGRVISATPTVNASGEARPADVEEQTAVQDYYHARARRALETQMPGVQFALRTLVLPLGDNAPRPGSNWTPGGEGAARNFLLRVVMITPSALGADDQGVARNAISQALALDPAHGDSIEFETGPIDTAAAAIPPATAAPSVAPATPPASTMATTSGAPDAAWPGLVGWIVAGCVVLVLLAGVALARALRPSTMAPAEHEAFAQRLRRQMNLADGADAAA